jgi:hypothetical protein
LLLVRIENLSSGVVKTRLLAGAIYFTERSGPFLGTSASDKIPIPNGSGDDAFSGAGLIQADDSPPLPVELASLEGAMTEGGVRLAWQTASETGNSGFEVQRRVASAPGASARMESTLWKTVGFVKSQAPGGPTSEARSYRFTDADLPYDADRLFYRLKQIDTDGTTALTDPVVVTQSIGEVELLAPVPTPASQQASLRYALPTRQEVEIRLYDALGRQVRTVVNGWKEGRHEETIGVGGLPSGTYFLRLQAGNTVKTQRLTVVR